MSVFDNRIKQSVLLIIILFSFFPSFAQKSSELPADFFRKFSYTLPPSVDFDDSVQLKNEVSKLALELSKIQTEARSRYTIIDTTILNDFLRATVNTNIILEKYEEVTTAIMKCRTLKPNPAYVIPYGTIDLAYSNAFLSVKDGDMSPAFKSAFHESLIKEFNQVNIEFRNDIVNLQKGNYNSLTAQRSWRNLKAAFNQRNSKGDLDYPTALVILRQYIGYARAKKYQPIIESALFALTPSKVKEQQIKIPMRDGIRLNAYVYSDLSNTEKLPALVSLSPYPSGTEATQGNVFASNGYIYVYVDNRGRRESEGTFMPYEDDAQDFYDIIDWVSKQPWCNGQVATTGGSYLGFAQWQAIRKQFKHPALKAINPMVSVGFGVDFPRYAHQFYPYILRWAVYVSGKELNQALFNNTRFWDSKYYELYKNRIPFSKLDSVAGMPNAIFQKWISHPNFDSYWQNILPSQKDYEAIDIPIFSITGYYDDDQIGAMYYYNNHQKYGSAESKAKHHLLIGPYNHGGAQWSPFPLQIGSEEIETGAQIPIYKYVIQWFDWVLKGKKKPDFIKGKISYFETGNNTWKGTETFKKLTTDSLELFLTPTVVQNKKRKNVMVLDESRAVGNSLITYQHDIAMALDSSFLFVTSNTYEDTLYLTSAYNLVFESQPLKEDIIVSDKILTRLYMRLNVPDADFEISIREISPDGKDRELAQDRARVRYRNGGEKPQLVKPGETFLLNFDNAFIYIKKISKGSRLRLAFRSQINFQAEKNFGFGGEVSKESTSNPRIIKATIMTGNKFPSKVVIPYRSDER